MSEPPISASIVIPTYNRADFLRRSVASALAAMPCDGEVVVSDDGDISATEAALAEFDRTKIVISANPGAKGPGGNRNHGVSVARGKIVFFLDDDDLLFPDYPARVLQAIASQDAAAWGFSATEEHLDAQTTVDAAMESQPIEALGTIPDATFLAGLGCGFWIKRELYQRIGGISEDLQINEDTDFCLALLSQGYMPLYAPTPGVSLYRAVADGLTRTSSARVRADCFHRIFERHREYLTSNADLRRFVLERYAKHAGRSRDISAGVEALRMSATLTQSVRVFGIFALSLALGER